MAKNFMELGAAKAPENRVLIVDTLNLGFRWKHQNRTDFAEDYISTVQSFATSYNCGTIIAAMDRGHSAYRRSLYPEYKADRAEKYKDQTSSEEMFAFLENLDDEQLYSMFADQVFSLGKINQLKNDYIYRSTFFFITALISELLIIMYMAYSRALPYIFSEV